MTIPSLPPTARLFTSDAVSMYTNIHTDHAIAQISEYLHKSILCRELKIRPEPVVAALKIIMQNNIFQFGDTHWIQLSGTAMGTPPAPSYATLYFAIYEQQILDGFRSNLHFYTRYIDDVFGIWIPDADSQQDSVNWSLFQKTMNSFGPKPLQWEFTQRTTSVEFLDLTIKINSDGKIETQLFEKALNLYLYLPPHSCHPPGALAGLITGAIMRIRRLTSNPSRCAALIKIFYGRLLARGYHNSNLCTLFQKIMLRLAIPPRPSPPTEPRLYFHLDFHPDDPSSRFLQKTFRETLLSPSHNSDNLADLRNKKNQRFAIQRMIVAYHRPKNLGSLLSPRRLKTTPDAPVSTFQGTLS